MAGRSIVAGADRLSEFRPFIAPAAPQPQVPHPLAALAPSVYTTFHQIGACRRLGMLQRGDDPMRWLTALLALLLLGLVAFPAVERVSAWLTPHADSVQSINYLSREIHELSASRRRATHRDLGPAD